MIGAIYGDIAGSKYEFHNIKTKDFKLFTDGCNFTDDTVCTIAVMDWLLHAKERNEKTMTEYMLKWTRKYPNVGYGGGFRRWINSSDPKPYGSYGNGAAMRISPIAWAAKDLDELEKLSNIVTGITHNHPEGYKGALVTATCIFMALQGNTLMEIKEYAISQYPIIRTFIYLILKETYYFDETCEGTVPQAIYCFLISKRLDDCAKTTISIGGDCDTTSAISCAISEAYYGSTSVESNIVRSYLTDEMNQVVDEFKGRYGEPSEDKYNLSRFITEQRYDYDQAKKELLNGRKESHWMWYIFPQLRGLGHSDMAYEYGISGLEEAEAYYNHPVLGKRLIELCNILLRLNTNDPVRIFGTTDAMKLKSSMTLFYKVGCNQLFRDVLRKYYFGELDQKTIEILKLYNDKN